MIKVVFRTEAGRQQKSGRFLQVLKREGVEHWNKRFCLFFILNQNEVIQLPQTQINLVSCLRHHQIGSHLAKYSVFLFCFVLFFTRRIALTMSVLILFYLFSPIHSFIIYWFIDPQKPIPGSLGTSWEYTICEYIQSISGHHVHIFTRLFTHWANLE